MTPTQNLGERLKTARRRRRISQDELAHASGLYVGIIRKLEQGKRTSARLETVTALAAALDVPISELLGVEPGLVGDPHADVASIRAALYDRADDREPRGLEELRAQVLDMRALYWQARYVVLAGEMPTVLADVRAALRAAATDDDRREANAILAEALQITASLVTHLAYEDLAHLALIQATQAADQAEDPLLIAAQKSTTAWVLSRQGLWQQAHDLASSAARDIEPVLSKAGPDQIGIWGELLHFGMVALAREGRADEAHELLAMVQAAGHAIGKRVSTKYKVPFGPTWAAHSAVQLHQATDQPRLALEAAERVENLETLPVATQARYLLNVAWAACMEWRNQEALDALRKIETIAPELLDHHGLARSIVEDLMPRRRKQRLPGLATIANRMNIGE